MTQKRSKIIMATLIFLLAISLIVVLIFLLPEVSVEWARLIIDNPITREICHIFWSFIPSLICIPIAFANIVCAVKGLRLVYKEKTSTFKRLIGYWIYAIISSGALVVHWLTFVYVVECAIAG